MAENDIIKEALLEDMDFWSGKRMSNLDPRTWIPSIGKSEKASNSPSYRSALRVMDKIDREVRKTFEKQKKLIPLLRWSKFKMNIGKFAHAADSFIKYQMYMDALLNDPAIHAGLESLMNQYILDLYGKSAVPAEFEKINPSDKLQEIASEIETVKANFQRPDLDWRNLIAAPSPAATGQPAPQPAATQVAAPQSAAAALVDNSIKKEALMGWLHKLPEMQELSENIKNLYEELLNMYTENKLYLKTLAKAYNTGSMKRFIESAKEFHSAAEGGVRRAKKLFDARLTGIIQQHHQRIRVQDEKAREEQEERDRIAAQRKLEREQKEQPPALGGPNENNPGGEETDVEPAKPSQPPTPPPEALEPDNSNAPVPGSEDSDHPLTASWEDIVERINKTALITNDPYRVAYEILVAAEKADRENDHELSNKLMAVAEEAFDE